MFRCYLHAWDHIEKPCPLCHPIETYTSSSATLYIPPVLRCSKCDSLESQLTEARERLRVACELLDSAKGWARTHAMQTYSKVASQEANEIEEFLSQIQEPNGKKGG